MSVQGLDPEGCPLSVLAGILNVKRLKICGTKDDYILSRLGNFQYCDLSHLYQLESLSVVLLKKIGFLLAQNATSRLPPTSGFATESAILRFPQLKLLLLDWTNPALWKNSSEHFPCLECLVLRHFRSLVSVHEHIAYIMTLQLLALYMCKPSVVASAKEIQQEVGRQCLRCLCQKLNTELGNSKVTILELSYQRLLDVFIHSTKRIQQEVGDRNISNIPGE